MSVRNWGGHVLHEKEVLVGLALCKVAGMPLHGSHAQLIELDHSL